MTMFLPKILLSVFVAFLGVLTCPGQMMHEPEDNWLRNYGIYPESQIFFRYDRYSKADLVNFRNKLDLFSKAEFNEWEGLFFSDNIQLGVEELRLKSGVGYVHYYVYSCHPELRYMDYGKVIDSSDSITLSPELSTDSPRKSDTIKYVKIRWADRYYLVKEQSLAQFAEKAAGVYIEQPDSDVPQTWLNYFVKGDMENSLKGLPVFPAAYKNLQRFPVDTTIVGVGKRTVESDKQFGNTTYSNSALYPITIGAGKNEGVKKGMKFTIPSTGDVMFITVVSPRFSTGSVVRSVDENKVDDCRSDEGNQISVPKNITAAKNNNPCR